MNSLNFVFLLIFSIILFYKSNYLAKITDLFDKPDFKRKIHKKPVPKIGGLIIYLNIVIYLILNNEIINSLNLIIFFTFFFIIGLLDDFKNLSSIIRLFITSIFIIIYCHYFSEVKVTKIYIFDNIYYLENYFSEIFVILFTTICILLLQNALNMIDGINTICALFTLYCLIIFGLKNNFLPLDIFIILIIIIFLYFNFKNFTYLGNSGSYLLSSFIILRILIDNSKYTNYSAEEIFLVLMIPGIDMLRLFITRIINKKNPFSADNNHIHHLLLNVFNNKLNTSIIVTFFTLILPGIFNLIFEVNKIFLILLFLFFYIFLIIKIRSNKNY